MLKRTTRKRARSAHRDAGHTRARHEASATRLHVRVPRDLRGVLLVEHRVEDRLVGQAQGPGRPTCSFNRRQHLRACGPPQSNRRHVHRLPRLGQGGSDRHRGFAAGRSVEATYDAPMDIEIRAELAADAADVHTVVASAFADESVAVLWGDLAARPRAASYVAVIDGAIVGHVGLSRGWIDSRDSLVDVHVLSPLSVQQSHAIALSRQSLLCGDLAHTGLPVQVVQSASIRIPCTQPILPGTRGLTADSAAWASQIGTSPTP